jgi:hypothetical protein
LLWTTLSAQPLHHISTSTYLSTTSAPPLNLLCNSSPPHLHHLCIHSAPLHLCL